jgi:N-acetylmuramoyl-L-alanine amidase
MVAVIVEGAYLSNPGEAAQLSTPEFRQRLANGIAQGLFDYLGASPSPGGAPPPAGGLGLTVRSPSNISVTRVGANGAEVRWDGVFGATGYRVWRDGTLVANLGLGASRFDDAGVAGGTHRYEVRATRGWLGESASATALLAMPWTIVVDPGHGGADSGAIGHY